MTGTTIAQVIPVAISPILTRLYTPQDFGLLAIFVSVTTIFGAVANGRYELAIMLPENDEDAVNIAALGLLISTTLSFLLLIVVILFNTQISQLLENNLIGKWLYLAPVSVFFIGLFNVLNYYNTRQKNYKDIAAANVYKSLALATIQLGIGFLKSGATGLILGQLASVSMSNFRLSKNIFRTTPLRKIISYSQIKKQAIRYKDFPKYSMWAILANTLSVNLINVLISLYYSITTLGFYSLVQRVLAMPTSLIGGAIGQVYFQQASKEKQATGKAITTFDQTAKKLIFFSVLFFTPLFFVIEDIFEIAFGPNWRIAGYYAKILIPLFALRFIASPLSTTNSVFEKQKISLVWQLLLLGISIATLLVSEKLQLDFNDFIIILSVVSSIHYLVLLFILFHVSRANI